MSILSEEAVKAALQTVKYPGFSRDIVSFGLVKGVQVANGAVNVQITLTTGDPEISAQVRTACETVLREIEGVEHVFVDVRRPAGGASQSGPADSGQNRVAGIGRIIAVASGKGGVGKSTTSVNLACGLKHLGAKVGLLDCDIYGPSIPLMMGVKDRPSIDESERIVPLEHHGVKLMSMGFLLDDDQPVIWRGPMIMKTIQQFIHSVAWGELDFLIVDLPPGTGDAQLSLCQTVPLDGGVIVTTPQEASLGVVRKGVAMFEKVNVPILGIVENMSYYTTPTGDRVELFGNGGGKAEAERKGVSFLGEVPMFVEIREGGDSGVPVVVSAPDSAASEAFLGVARNVFQKFNEQG